MNPGARLDPVWGVYAPLCVGLPALHCTALRWPLSMLASCCNAGLMALYTIAEITIILLLVMPMPSNKLRGQIQGVCAATVPAIHLDHHTCMLDAFCSVHNPCKSPSHSTAYSFTQQLPSTSCCATPPPLPYCITGAVSKLWNSQEYVKKTSWVLLTLNS